MSKDTESTAAATEETASILAEEAEPAPSRSGEGVTPDSATLQPSNREPGEGKVLALKAAIAAALEDDDDETVEALTAALKRARRAPAAPAPAPVLSIHRGGRR